VKIFFITPEFLLPIPPAVKFFFSFLGGPHEGESEIRINQRVFSGSQVKLRVTGFIFCASTSPIRLSEAKSKRPVTPPGWLIFGTSLVAEGKKVMVRKTHPTRCK
jgi:hypothetical protein